MNKCVLIVFSGDLTNEELQTFLHNEAQERHFEGVVQSDGTTGHIKITVCGIKEVIDQFIDNLYSVSGKFGLTDIEVEPFFKHKDFRGVFRILK